MERVKKVLDIGYGGRPFTAFSTSSLAKLSPDHIQYYGIDLEDPTVLKAGNLDCCLHPNNIHLLRMDATKLAFADKAFDEAYMHFFVTCPQISIPDIRFSIKEAMRTLKDEGLLSVCGERETFPDHDSEQTREQTTTRIIREEGFFMEDIKNVKDRMVFPPESMIKLSHNQPGNWFIFAVRK